MRLIDADALKMEVRKEYDRLYPTASGEFDEFATRVIPYIIDEQPTVDAEPVRYGEWVCIFESDENDNVQCNCSVCGAGDLHAKDAVVPYCWKCGAKMVE